MSYVTKSVTSECDFKFERGVRALGCGQGAFHNMNITQQDAVKTSQAAVRVVVRVRPRLDVDGPDAACSLLSVSPGQHGVVVKHPADQRACKQYAFDAVLGVESTQDDLYEAVRVSDLVGSVLAGYHATVFAYGQTGSGKTYTMEGYRYTSPTTQPTLNRQGSYTSSRAAKPPLPPCADFDNTPSDRLGLVPRAVEALFQAIQKQSATMGTAARHTSIKVSYVQLYKEQVYDLLNPSGGSVAAEAGHKGNSKGSPAWGVAKGGPLPGRPLHMRWSKSQEFYLENLFKVQCATAAEVLAAFRQGVRAKVMASHAMNQASSRSHSLLTLYVDSYPVTSPNEVTSARLTLVDLAGSERSSAIGVQEGTIHDESVAINRSLLTLRQVIVALTSNLPRASTTNSQPPNSTPQQVHVPYRDSKLTALLKQSLGGSSLTTMVACVACADSAYEENVSTLDYAAMARRVVNQVLVNEDPKVRVIRELRQEVAFLRGQLAALQGPQLSPQAPTNSQPTASAPAISQPHLLAAASQHPISTPSLPKPGAAGGTAVGTDISAQAGSGGPSPGQPVTDGFAAVGAGSVAHMDRSGLLQAAEQDMQALVEKLVTAAQLVQQLSSSNQELRGAYLASQSQQEALQVDNDRLREENALLRDRLDLIEGMAGVSAAGAGGAGAAAGEQGSAGTGPGPPVVHTAGAAALMELQELRQENAMLHMRLQALEFAPSISSHPSWPATHSETQVLVLDGPNKGGRGRLQHSHSLGSQQKRGGSSSSTHAAGGGAVAAGGLLSPARSEGAVSRGLRGSQTGPPGSAAGRHTGRGVGTPTQGAGALSSSPAVMSVSDLRAMLGSGGARTGTAGAMVDLTVRTHQLTTGALLSGVRVTTTGGLLSAGASLGNSSVASPGSTGGVLLSAGSHSGQVASGAAAGLNVGASETRQQVAGAQEAQGGGEVAEEDGAEKVPVWDAPLSEGDPMASKLVQLMAARNALARSRLNSGGIIPGGSPKRTE